MTDKQRRGTRRSVNRQIDENLRRVYEDALNEAVPDRFTELIRKLRTAEDAPPPPPAGRDRDDR
jgi:hypothetical protein